MMNENIAMNIQIDPSQLEGVERLLTSGNTITVIEISDCKHECPFCHTSHSHSKGNCDFPNKPKLICSNCIMKLDPKIRILDSGQVIAHKEDLEESGLSADDCKESARVLKQNSINRIKEIMNDSNERKAYLSNQEIADYIQREEEMFALLQHKIDIKELTPDAIELHLIDLNKKVEQYKIQAMTVKRLIRESEVKKLQSFTPEEYEEFNKAKKDFSERKVIQKAKARESEEEKQVRIMANKILKTRPDMNEEKAMRVARVAMGLD